MLLNIKKSLKIPKE